MKIALTLEVIGRQTKDEKIRELLERISKLLEEMMLLQFNGRKP